MEGNSRRDAIIHKVELGTIAALQVLVLVSVVLATVVLFVLFFNGLRTRVTRIESVGDLIPLMQQSFAGILIVVLGLELLETLKAYFVEHVVRLEVILLVAIIAVSRHVIQVDFEHTPGPALLGLSAVIVSLTLGYFLVKKAHDRRVPADDPKEQSDHTATAA